MHRWIEMCAVWGGAVWSVDLGRAWLKVEPHRAARPREQRDSRAECACSDGSQLGP